MIEDLAPNPLVSTDKQQEFFRGGSSQIYMKRLDADYSCYAQVHTEASNNVQMEFEHNMHDYFFYVVYREDAI